MHKKRVKKSNYFKNIFNMSSIQFVAQSCLILCEPVNCTMPAFPIHHHLPDLLKFMSIELMMPSNHLILCYPLLLPSILPTIRVFSNESVCHQVAKVLEVQLQHQSFLVWSPCCPRDSQESSPTLKSLLQHQLFGAQLSL